MKSSVFLLLFLVSPIYAMNPVDFDEKLLKSLVSYFKPQAELVVFEGEAETKNQIISILEGFQSKPEFNMFLAKTISEGDVDIIENLLGRCPKVDVNWKHPVHEQSLIHVAALKGDIKTLEILLKRGANIRSIGKAGENILHIWTHSGKPEFLDYILNHHKEAGIELLGKGYTETLTPLLFAVNKGKTEAAMQLIENGARMDEISKQGHNILHCWVHHADAPFLNYLCDNYKNNIQKWFTGEDAYYKFTPLFFTAASGKTEAAKLLIQYNANIFEKSSKGENILHAWIFSQNEGYINYLFKKYPDDAAKWLHERNKTGTTPLISAVLTGKTEAAKLLIEKGANINDIMASGENILHHWVYNAKTELLEYLFKNFPTLANKLLHDRDIKNGLTPLSLALKSNINTAKLLSAKIVNLSVTNKNEYNILHHWIFSQNGEFLDYLFNEYPNALKWLHAKASDEELTPLLYSASYGKTEAAEYLVKKGAEIGDKSKDGENILHLWTRSEDEAFFIYLFKRHHNYIKKYLDGKTKKAGHTPLLLAVKNGKFQAAKLLIQEKANINETDANGYNILHHWIFSQNSDFLDYLFNKYPEHAEKWLHAKASDEELTPLLYAVCYGKTEAVKYLVKKGAKIGDKSKNGENILHLWTRSQNEELFNYLFEQFSDKAQTWLREKTNNAGLTPLSLAEKVGKKEAADLLLKKKAISSSQNLINGTFDDRRHTGIQNLLNSLHTKKNFDALIGQIHLLEEFGDKVNQSEILLYLFNDMNNHYENDPLKFYEQINKTVKKIKIIPSTIKEWARIRLVECFQSLTSSFLKRDNFTIPCKFIQSVLADELVTRDYYHLGMILGVHSESKETSIGFLQKFLDQTAGNLSFSNEIIAASFFLNFIQDNMLENDYVENSQIPPEKLIEWVRKNYYNLGQFGKGFPFYVYNYLTKNLTKKCSFVDFLIKDYLFFQLNQYDDNRLILNSETDKQLLSSTFKMFSYSDLELEYRNFIKTCFEKKESIELGMFALLCLRQLMVREKKDDFECILKILEYNIKYVISTTGLSPGIDAQINQLFKTANDSYTKRSRNNTYLDSYRLGKIAYEICKRKEYLLITNMVCSLKNKEQEKILQDLIVFSEKLFTKVSKQVPSSLILGKSYYYRSLIRGMLNDPKNARKYLELFNFSKEKNHSQKITNLRGQVAQSAFMKQDFSGALNQYNEIQNSDGVLDKKATVIKMLCLNKLGYKEATDQYFQNILNHDGKNNLFLLELYEKAVEYEDNESTCMIYKLMKHYGFSLFGIIIQYLNAQLELHNFEEIINESEEQLAKDEFNEIVSTLPYLIVSTSKLNLQEKFTKYLLRYIEFSQHLLSTSAGREDITVMIETLNHFIFSNTMFNNTKREFPLEIADNFLKSSIPMTCSSAILMAAYLMSLNNHEAGYTSLLKAINFTKNSVNFDIRKNAFNNEVIRKDFTAGHCILKQTFPKIINSLIHLGKWDDLECLAKYLKTKHKITIKIKKPYQNNINDNNVNIPEDIRRYLSSSFLEQAEKNYQEGLNLIDSFHAVTASEWQKLNIVDFEDIKKKSESLFGMIFESLQLLKEVSQGKNISLEVMEKAHEAHDCSNNNIGQLNQLISELLNKVTLLRQKEERRKFFESTYQTSEESFFIHKKDGSIKNYRVFQKLLELQEQQKKALIEAYQKNRHEKRKYLQENYQENLSISVSEVEIPSNTLLIDATILPVAMNDYLPEHDMILHGILSKKMSLDDRDQETLRIILTNGERCFQITLNQMKKLFSKFEAFVNDIHHGGNHEKISGLGLTLMPNADGVKKGSYYGQLKEAKEKIIMIIAKTLTVEDLEHVQHEAADEEPK